MTTIAEAYVQLKPSMRGFTSDMNRQVGPEMDAAGRHAGKSFGGGMIPMLGGMAVAGAAALVGLGVAGIGAGLATAASMEQARIAFTTMLGSAQQADTFLKQLADFAAQTPFEFPELQTAASALISAGVQADKVIPIMRTLGNVTSGMGTGSEGVRRATVALQQMQAAGKITGEDLNQLRDAGIPVYDLLAAATGKSKEEVVALAQAGKLGKKELDAMMSALESGKGLEKFNGLMEAQSQSLSGLVSTFKDNLGQGLAKAVEPLIPLLKDGLGKTAMWLSETAMPALATGLKSTIEFFQRLSSSNGAGKARDVLAQVGTFVTTTLIPALKAIGDWISINVVPSVMELIAAFQRVYDVVAPIVTQLVSGIMEKVGPLMPTIIGIFTGIGSVIASAFSIIASIVRFVFDGISAFWAQWGGTITAYTSGMFSGIVNTIAAFVDIIKGIFSAVSLALKGDWSGAWEAIKAATSAAWGHLKQSFADGAGAIWRVIKDVGASIGDAFAAMWKGSKDVGSNIVQGIANGISNGIQWVVDAAKRVAGAALQAVKDFLGIKSPSQVMADQVGLQMSAGIGVGITRGSGLVDSAMNDMVARATRPVNLSASGAYASGGATGGAFSSGPLDLSDSTIGAIVNGMVSGASVASLATLANDKWSTGMGRETRGRAW